MTISQSPYLKPSWQNRTIYLRLLCAYFIVFAEVEDVGINLRAARHTKLNDHRDSGISIAGRLQRGCRCGGETRGRNKAQPARAMRSKGLAILAAFSAATASWAQDSLPGSQIVPKQVPIDKIAQAPVAPNDPMIGTDINGRLLIDWKLAERLALSSADPQRTALAKLMLAIRDGHWKAMPK